MHFGAPSRGLRTPCERFAPWVTPGPRITRFRLVADLGRMGLDTHRVSNKVSKITSRHLVLLDRAFPAHALVQGSSAALRQAIVDPLVLLMARGARSRHEVEDSSKVQDQISRWELAGVRASARAARRCDAVALCARDAWRPSPSGQPGGQKRFSDLAIETALTLRLVFRLPLRQAEGFLRSVLCLMDVDLEASDHTTLSRRSRHLDVALHRVPAKGPLYRGRG